MENVYVFIDGVRKSEKPYHDLLKSIGGKPLLLRAVDLARSMVDGTRICVLTDSEEIALACFRGDTNYRMLLDSKSLGVHIQAHLCEEGSTQLLVVILDCYAPLLQRKDIEQGVAHVSLSPEQVYVPKEKTFCVGPLSLVGSLDRLDHLVSSTYESCEHGMQIANLKDWFVMERFLARKLIVFHVVAYKEVGMGHLFRAYTLAKQFLDHDVVFVCSEASAQTVKDFLKDSYPLHVFIDAQVYHGLASMGAHLIVNDVLDTKSEHIRILKASCARVIHFEDLGTGPQEADLTINELYEYPVTEGKHILWGHQYFFVREEFQHAKPISFHPRVRKVLITFGGTDQHDFTRRTLRSVLAYCQKHHIGIHMVVGPGYTHKEALFAECKTYSPLVECTAATGIMSHIMEQVDIAISSNGRTVYEIAHMHIPGIILSQHDRENTHTFAVESNGFLPLGLGLAPGSQDQLKEAFVQLVEDTQVRERLHNHMLGFNFSGNLAKVERLFRSILDATPHYHAGGVGVPPRKDARPFQLISLDTDGSMPLPHTSTNM